MLKICLILYSVIYLSQELVLNDRLDDDIKNYYQMENGDKLEDMPIIIREINKGDVQHFKYKMVRPDETPDDEDDFKDYVMIKSKPKRIDVVPYALIKRLDKIKYMILWLNLYCDMHPDCDKAVLNEELRKVVSAVEEAQKEENYTIKQKMSKM